MPNVRTQIRGLKNSKPSNDKSAKKANKAFKKSVKKNMKAEGNEEKMQVKAANKFRYGGPSKKKSATVSNEPSYPTYNQFKDLAAKQGFNSDSTIYRHNPQNLRGVMAHNGVPADSVGVWSGRINRELSGIANKNMTSKYGNKVSGTIDDNGNLNIKKKGGKLSKRKPARVYKCGGKLK